MSANPSALAGIQGYLSASTTLSPPSYTLVANVIGDIGGIGVSNKMVDITPHAPGQLFTFEFPAIGTLGPTTFDVSFIGSTDGGSDGSSALLMKWAAQKTLIAWQFTWSNGHTQSWEGYISKCDVKAQHQGIMMGTITLSSFGAPTYA